MSAKREKGIKGITKFAPQPRCGQDARGPSGTHAVPVDKNPCNKRIAGFPDLVFKEDGIASYHSQIKMGLFEEAHQKELKASGWHSRGYLPHFDGITIPQFITVHLADSMPNHVIQSWKRELKSLEYEQEQIILQRRIEKYLDQGYGNALLNDFNVANMVQNALLEFDGRRYRLFAWVVMPNHVHSLMQRLEGFEIKDILHSQKSYTAHEANKLLHRNGQFWREDYFDRYMRNQDHFDKTVKYIENNPLKARLCSKPSDWPFSSARFRDPK